MRICVVVPRLRRRHHGNARREGEVGVHAQVQPDGQQVAEPGRRHPAEGGEGGEGAERFAGGVGVMADDLVAGILAALVLWLSAIAMGYAL